MISELGKNITFLPSQHFSGRENKPIDGVVIHYTGGGSAHGSIAWAQNAASKVSWHFLISREGDVYQQVPIEYAAWHAGASEMLHQGEMTHGANRFTLGIELCNYGFLFQDRHGDFWSEVAGTMKRYRRRSTPLYATLRFDNQVEIEGWWEPYPEAQLGALAWLLKRIETSPLVESDCCYNVVGHEEIAMPFGLRKRDPGPLFPWDRFTRTYRRRTESSYERDKAT